MENFIPPESLALTDLDDVALTEALLARHEGAWQEFVRRFEPLLRYQVGKVLSCAVRQVLDSDAVDDVIGDFNVLILDDDMQNLRLWFDSGHTAQLATYLCKIASHIAVDHIRRAFYDRGAKMMADVDEHDDDRNRGGSWLGAEMAERLTEAEIDALEKMPKRRNRLSLDDA